MIEGKQIDRQFMLQRYYSAFDFNWNESFQYEGEAHDFWEIVYVMSGAVDVTEDARIYQLTEGMMVLHAPMEFHSIRSAENTSPHVLITTFSTQGELPACLMDGTFTLSYEMRQTFEKIFYQILQFVQEQPGSEPLGQESADRLSAFLLRLSRRYQAENPLLLSRSAKEYHNLVQAMTKRVWDNCTLEELARQCRISASYMKVLFRRYAGISPKMYYARLRCSEAIRLLQEGMTAVEVADRLGFSSPNYFSVFFKKMTGLPPAKYIRSRTEDDRGR